MDCIDREIGCPVTARFFLMLYTSPCVNAEGLPKGLLGMVCNHVVEKTVLFSSDLEWVQLRMV